MILYEVLRLYPPVPVLERTTFKPIQIGSLVIPSGAVLVLPTVLIHRDPSNWGNDAGEFNPMRFSQGVSKALKDQYAFFPFGGGPRVCIGQNFAMLEAKMALSVILQRFSFELSASYAHAPTTRFTLQPQHGAPLKFHRLWSERPSPILLLLTKLAHRDLCTYVRELDCVIRVIGYDHK